MILVVSYWAKPGTDNWCSKCGANAEVFVEGNGGTLTDWLCVHCAAHHMRGNADAFDDREPDECDCPPGRWEA